MLAQTIQASSRFTRRDGVRFAVATTVLVAVLSAIFAADIVPDRLAVEVGSVAPADIVAPRALTYTSQVRTEAARQAARDAVPPQYDYTPENAAAVAAEQAAEYARRIAPIEAAFASPLTPQERDQILAGVLADELSEAARTTLRKLTPERWAAVRDEAGRVLDTVERSELRDTEVAAVRARLAGRMVGLSPSEADLAAELIGPLIVPNSSYSEELTNQARDRAAEAVSPVVVSVQRGEIIVRRGEPIDAFAYEKIVAFGLDQARPDVARLVGYVFLAALAVVPLVAWFWRFRPTFWHRTNVLLLVSLLLVVAAVALKVTAGRAILPFFVPTAAAAILTTILVDAWAATLLMVVLAVVAGGLSGGSQELATYVLLGGLAGILGIRRGDRLHDFVQAGLAILVANVLVVSTFALLGERDLRGILELWAASGLSAGGAAIAAVGSFAVLGNLFGITTVFQLLELANPSQPLLRRLLLETPGTYHHSLMVGNLAERAAEAIGADPLLARVAAYYHDIGKLANPAAFIENQSGGENIHDQLPPEQSAQLLKAHVADGIDIAYQYRLPKTLIAFIPQHHGTALMSYFYAKARELAAAPYGGLETAEGRRAADAVDERRFRHAGPKPQSREAAILMLADGVEASVRSLASRDEATIRAMVNRIIEERLTDGQFDECDLTLRDIERIREAFVSQLLGMYHQRIAYPQNKIVEIEARRAGRGGPRGS
jgi:putative nucleotidyltransferase with HDIG domain